MTQETGFNQPIVDKIKKLLAMANDQRGNENECALAMERVQQLLASYNLTLAQVESTMTPEGPKVQDGKREKSNIERSAMYEYQRELMRIIAETHYCMYLIGEKHPYNPKTGRYGKRKYHVLIGREANVTTAGMMFDYLNGTIDKMANELYPHPTNVSKPAILWKEGCAYRLRQRLKEKKQKADAEQEQAAKESAAQGGCNLMLLTDVRANEYDLNTDFYYGREPGTTARLRLQWQEEAKKREAERAEVVIVEEKEVISEKERKRREEQQRKRNERWWRKWDREDSAKRAKYNSREFQDGYRRGDDVGLDDQIGKAKDQNIIK